MAIGVFQPRQCGLQRQHRVDGRSRFKDFRWQRCDQVSGQLPVLVSFLGTVQKPAVTRSQVCYPAGYVKASKPNYGRVSTSRVSVIGVNTGGEIIKRPLAIVVTSFAIVFVVAVGAWLYVLLNGTPWGKARAQQTVLTYIKTNYHWSNPNIVSPMAWDWKLDQYEIGVTFPAHSSNTYFFGVRNGHAYWYVTLPTNGSTDPNFNTTEKPPTNTSN